MHGRPRSPWWSPATRRSARDFVALACELSEEFDTPVLYRTTTRVCHSKGLVQWGERRSIRRRPTGRNVRKFVCTPAHAYANHPLVGAAAAAGGVRLHPCAGKRPTSGSWATARWASSRPPCPMEYAKGGVPGGTSFLKLGLTFPLPMDLIRDFASRVEKALCHRGAGALHGGSDQGRRHPCVGKELTGLLYELNTQLLRERVLGEKNRFPQD